MPNETKKIKESILTRRKYIRIFSFLLALLGLGVSLFLTYEYASDEPIPCALNNLSGISCESVRQSDFSTLFGIDIPVWGNIFFVLVLTFLFFSILNFISEKREKEFNILLLLLLGFGAIFETGLTLISIFVIQNICIWCTLVEITVIFLFIINAMEIGFSWRKLKSINN